MWIKIITPYDLNVDVERPLICDHQTYIDYTKKQNVDRSIWLEACP